MITNCQQLNTGSISYKYRIGSFCLPEKSLRGREKRGEEVRKKVDEMRDKRGAKRKREGRKWRKRESMRNIRNKTSIDILQFPQRIQYNLVYEVHNHFVPPCTMPFSPSNNTRSLSNTDIFI